MLLSDQDPIAIIFSVAEWRTVRDALYSESEQATSLDREDEAKILSDSARSIDRELSNRGWID